MSEYNHNQVKPDPREAPETTDFNNIPRDLGNSACVDMQGLSAPNPKQLPATAQREVSKRTIDCVENASSVETTKIILERVNRRGRSSASLLDGTILVGSSRQPFLDAARILIAAGYDPDSWLEGWRPGATAFALRARLGIAAGLTVDETKTVFAKWKPFSSSAVASSIDHSEIPATTLAAAPSALLQPQHEQQSKMTSETEPGAARPAPSSTDECTEQSRSSSTFDNGSSSSSRA